MGCGSSSTLVTTEPENIENNKMTLLHDSHDDNTKKPNSVKEFEIAQGEQNIFEFPQKFSRNSPLGIEENALGTGERDHARMQDDQLPDQGDTLSWKTNESELEDEDLDFAAHLLGDIMVDNVIDSLTTLPAFTKVIQQNAQAKHNRQTGRPASKGKEATNRRKVHFESFEKEDLSPTPSAVCKTPTCQTSHQVNDDTNVPPSHNINNEVLHAMMRASCSATDHSLLCDVASNADALYLQRSMSFTPTPQNNLVRFISSINQLKQLNVSNNNPGPVAFRALLVALIKHDCVHDFDISDNMADSECAELVGKLISTSSCLRCLNLSGNQLGKEALSRCLSTSMQVNAKLVHLNISGCGATNLHGLFEALRMACSQGSSLLEFLDISNNHINDGQQLGIDLSLIFENPGCKLSHVNVTNVALMPNGWAACVSGLKANTSLREFLAGGSANMLQNVCVLSKIMFSTKNLLKLNLASIRMAEELKPEDMHFDPEDCSIDLSDLDLSDTCLVDEYFSQLASNAAGKLCNLKFLNLSNNCDLTDACLLSIKQLCSNETSSKLTSLSLSALSLDCLPTFLQGSFPHVSSLTLRKSRIPINPLMQLSQIPQVLNVLILDGIKFSGTGLLNSILSSSSHHQLTKIGLCGCSVTDADLQTLVTAIGRKGPPLNSLVHLDLSVNRITSASVIQMLNALGSTKNHPLEVLYLSNNLIEDEGACSISKCIMSASSSNLKKVDISRNCVTSVGILALVNTLAATPSGGGLISLDVSNQKEGMMEDDIESVVTSIATTLGFDVDLLTQEDRKQSVPHLSPKFNVNLRKLGGAAGIKAKMFDSVAIKTDFSNLCYTSANLTDYLSIAAGLGRNCSSDASSSSSDSNKVTFTSQEWTSIIGSDAPAWLNVQVERRKGVYINHLPGTATLQRLEGMLEMEADCEVVDVYLIKDPILRKPTGAAWVLFANEDSVYRALDWFSAGEAQMYGTPFYISCLPVETTDGQSEADAMAKRDMAAREKQRKQGDDEDRAMMEASQQIADERAAYRETHPAYQNGRIW